MSTRIQARGPRVCVVGAGVIGLSTAVRLLQTLPGLSVDLRAEDFSPHTTSDIAAGIWKPHCLKDTPAHLIQRWGDATFDYMMQNIRSEDAGLMGAQLVHGNMVFTKPNPEECDCKDTVLGFRNMSQKEMDMKCGPGYATGWDFSSPLMECKIYLPWLLNRFKQLGGNVIVCKVHNLRELYKEYDVIVNCAGVGARDLASDLDLTAARGQAIKVKAPWVKEFLIIDEGEAYIIPGTDQVTLGGTFQENNWNKNSDGSDTKKIWERCCNAMPSLKNCQIVQNVVGLRPSRSTLRLERQTVGHCDRKIHIVHNYGHGGAGVTLHWGCAGDATQLVVEAVQMLQQQTAKL